MIALAFIAGAMIGLFAAALCAAASNGDRVPEDPEVTASMRVIRAADCTYDQLCAWESLLLDAESADVSSVIIARNVVSELRDRVAAGELL